MHVVPEKSLPAYFTSYIGGGPEDFSVRRVFILILLALTTRAEPF